MYKSNLTIHYYINTKIKHVVDKLKREIAPSFYSLKIFFFLSKFLELWNFFGYFFLSLDTTADFIINKHLSQHILKKNTYYIKSNRYLHNY